jgi:hypothetical protein
MRKRTRKLTLHRETLGQLNRPDLEMAAGAATLTCYPDPCEYSKGRATCTTCNLTCNTNTC